MNGTEGGISHEGAGEQSANTYFGPMQLREVGPAGHGVELRPGVDQLHDSLASTVWHCGSTALQHLDNLVCVTLPACANLLARPVTSEDLPSAAICTMIGTEKSAPFGAIVTRSLVVYQAAQLLHPAYMCSAVLLRWDKVAKAVRWLCTHTESEAGTSGTVLMQWQECGSMVPFHDSNMA